MQLIDIIVKFFFEFKDVETSSMLESFVIIFK